MIILPPEDLDLSTDPCVYRQMIDALPAHLARHRVKQITLIPPLRFGTNDKLRQALWRSVRDAAATYKVSFVAPPPTCLDEKLWRLDPKTKNIYGLSPNAEGLKEIELYLLP